MWQASFQKHVLDFKFVAGTSRGSLTQKDSYFIKIWKEDDPTRVGVGEASLLPKLSIDHHEYFEQDLRDVIDKINKGKAWEEIDLSDLPSVQFALEIALRDWEMGGNSMLYDNAFSRGEEGIPINGLIWMNTKEEMYKQIKAKIEAGFGCIKMKIGAIDFEDELELLRYIRTQFTVEDMILRVDANGAFEYTEALEKLKRLSVLDLHSIEQPIRQGNIDQMRQLCESSPLPIALDEELIGVNDPKELLDAIQPQYIILKPSLIGGWEVSDQWIRSAEERSIGWWITSALESNIGLNAIAQWCANKKLWHDATFQGLGTGQLFSNNVKSPLKVIQGALWHN